MSLRSFRIARQNYIIFFNSHALNYENIIKCGDFLQIFLLYGTCDWAESRKMWMSVTNLFNSLWLIVCFVVPLQIDIKHTLLIQGSGTHALACLCRVEALGRWRTCGRGTVSVHLMSKMHCKAKIL